jgi:putative adhesin
MDSDQEHQYQEQIQPGAGGEEPSGDQPERAEAGAAGAEAGGAGEAAAAASDEIPDQPEAPRIEIDLAEGDLSIRGGSARVELDADGDEMDDDPVEHRHGTLRFSRLPNDSILRVPDGTRLLIRQVFGSLDVKHLDGYVQVERVSGDVELDYVAVCELGQVSGDLEARHGGALHVRSVFGDAVIEDYDEAPVIGTVAGELDVANLPAFELREAVGGDLTVDSCGVATLAGTIGGDLTARRSIVIVRGSAIGGDVEIASAREVVLAAVGGDFTVRGATGPVEVASIGGDADVREAAGHVRISTVGGDLTITNASAGLAVRRVGGDAEIDTVLYPHAEYDVHAGGDISLRVRGEVNARFVAQTTGGEIRTRLPLTVERGRRRNLVGVIGRGEATVTLRSDGGDISIAATDDRFEEERTMGDEFVGREGEEREGRGGAAPRTWEGNVGRHRFRVRWDRGPGHANVHFQGPFTEDEDPDGVGQTGSRDFGFHWDRNEGARMYGEYEQRLNELRDKAERVARKAAEQAQDYAEKASRRARETDWESVGREVRSAIEKAMADLEDAFGQVRREWETRRPSGSSTAESKPGAQRVRIEFDDEGDAMGGGASQASAGTPGMNRDEAEAARRGILEELRNGAITLDEAERRLNELR